MSTHRLDVSGARPLTTTTNDPAATVASTGAKAGDDVTAQLSGFRELRVSLGDGSTTRVERRRYIRKTMRRHEGQPVKENGEYVYDEKPEEELVLVFSSGGTFFGRTSVLPEEGQSERADSVFEPTPHTNVVAKRWGELHMLEQGTLVESYPVGELVDVVQKVVAAGKVSGGSDEIGTPDTLTPRGG